jgi:superfamily I DNA and/or RNA helicase
MEDTLDYLFVDEAGQVSLGHLAAMGAAAKNIIIIGDQMQLSQPVQGTHPGDSGKSTLEYLLEGQDTVPEHRGILLPVSYRLNPSICDFISEAVYEGRLKPAPGNWQQKLYRPLDENLGIGSEGIGFIDVSHEGRSQRSDEEGEVISGLFHRALKNRYIDSNGIERDMTMDDIMIVAPYNAQVNYLKKVLPVGARVGTIDLFQGQEAQVVLISMTTSSKDSLPRNIEFLFSRNRLNVAVSRAKCLAVVVASPRLLTISCRTIGQMKLVNFLCSARDYAQEIEY